MATTVAFDAKKYLTTQLDDLLTDYNANILVTYGPTTQDVLGNVIEVLGITWESTETYSTGGSRMKTWETFTIECAITVIQLDGTCEDVEASVYDIYQVIENFIRDDVAESHLGGYANFAKCLPSSLLSDQGPNGGSAAQMLFDIEIQKKVS